MVAQVNSAATAPELFYEAAPSFHSLFGVATETVVVDLNGAPIERPPVKGRDWVETSLSNIGALEHDWDGYGAEPISTATAGIIQSLLKQLLPKNAPIGSIVPGADGSLQAEWHLRRVEFGLLVEANGHLSAWVFPRGGAEVERKGLAGLELFRAVAQFELA